MQGFRMAAESRATFFIAHVCTNLLRQPLRVHVLDSTAHGSRDRITAIAPAARVKGAWSRAASRDKSEVS